VGAILLEQNDEWAVQRCRYMTLETIAALGDDAAVDRRPWLSDPSGRRREIAAAPILLHHVREHDHG